MRNKKTLGNSLRSYFSKPANVITIIFLIVLLLTLPFWIKNGIYHAGPLITGVPMEIKHVAFNA